MWIAGASGTNKIIYSYNGITWTVSTSGNSLFSGGTCYAVAWNGTRWVAGGNGSTNKIIYSSDGINWIASTSGNTVFTGQSCYAVAWNGTRWVAGGNGATNKLAYSPDGITWTPSTSGNSLFSSSCYSLAWNGTFWVAGGQGTTNRLAYSFDGITWTASISGNSLITTAGYGLASRRVLPYIGTITNHFQVGSTGPTGPGALGDYFINTTNKNLYAYGATGATGAFVWNSILGFDSYTADTTVWDSPYPTTVTEAIDRLALAVYGLLGNPIPVITSTPP